ncbi:hypothetical protein [Pontibacter fetidus]|uniref:Uncharacterized protein n=1 Tax=Pontibacter fetidus TaxID=2700082 RepID=A0A6B2H622_9BACT|nr:hypothetical protein [Pontibacter fetidus]NDK54514.1 hypothetical protein [Pontibacter fetidus]
MKHFKVLSPLFLGGLIAYFLLLRLYNKEENFEELALGEQTVSHFAYIDGVPIHIMGVRNYELLKKRWEQSSKDSTILVLGNSQTHSVNQMSDGETTYPALLHDELANTKYEVLASSLPNANLQELYLVLDFMTRELPVTHVTIPVFWMI